MLPSPLATAHQLYLRQSALLTTMIDGVGAHQRRLENKQLGVGIIMLLVVIAFVPIIGCAFWCCLRCDCGCIDGPDRSVFPQLPPLPSSSHRAPQRYRVDTPPSPEIEMIQTLPRLNSSASYDSVDGPEGLPSSPPSAL